MIGDRSNEGIQVERKPNSYQSFTNPEEAGERKARERNSIPVAEMPKGSLRILPSSLELPDCSTAIYLAIPEMFLEQWSYPGRCCRHLAYIQQQTNQAVIPAITELTS